MAPPLDLDQGQMPPRWGDDCRVGGRGKPYARAAMFQQRQQSFPFGPLRWAPLAREACERPDSWSAANLSCSDVTWRSEDRMWRPESTSEAYKSLQKSHPTIFVFMIYINAKRGFRYMNGHGEGEKWNRVRTPSCVSHPLMLLPCCCIHIRPTEFSQHARVHCTAVFQHHLEKPQRAFALRVYNCLKFTV